MKPNKFLKNKSGIYGIRNLINDKIYIGKTKCMYRRCHQYVYDFNNRKIGHLNNYLYNAINKVGINNFEFFPLQFDEISKLRDLELAWMIHLKSTNTNYGYNIRMDSCTGMIVSKSTRLKISNNLRKQWKNGVRDDHSEKLKNIWKNNTKRRNKQSKLFLKMKTKYEYKIYHQNGIIEKCYYARLVELGLKNVIATFYRKKNNDVKHKNYRIIRYPKGESNEAQT